MTQLDVDWRDLKPSNANTLIIIFSPNNSGNQTNSIRAHNLILTFYDPKALHFQTCQGLKLKPSDIVCFRVWGEF